MYNILIIDDHSEIMDANSAHFTSEGFFVTSAYTGIKALSFLNDKRFDCIVLDVLLPDLDGFTICKAVRTITNTPIIFLTCLDDLNDMVKGFAAGGDDYLTKPYSLKELSARVRSLIRRNQLSSTQPIADFYIDHDNKMIHTKEKNLFLSQKEYDLFMLFYENPNTIFSKEEIIGRIWRDVSVKPDGGVVTVYISKLRRKIFFAQKQMGCIKNSYGEGYVFVPPKCERDFVL